MAASSIDEAMCGSTLGGDMVELVEVVEVFIMIKFSRF